MSHNSHNHGPVTDVNLYTTLSFKYVKDYQWSGVPIMISNMDTTGTFEMYNKFSKYKMITIFHKHYKIEDYPDNLDKNY